MKTKKQPNCRYLLSLFCSKNLREINEFCTNHTSLYGGFTKLHSFDSSSVEFAEILSHAFDKSFVKATFLLKKLLIGWFHEIFFRWERRISGFSTAILEIYFCKYYVKSTDLSKKKSVFTKYFSCARFPVFPHL